MANIKIANLPTATTVSSSDYLILDQSDATKKIKFSDLSTVNEELLSSTSGSSMVGLKYGGTVEDSITYVTPEMFSDDIQTAVTYASENGLSIRLSAKEYTINSPILVTGSLHIQGSGQHLTKIIQSSTATDCVFIQTITDVDNGVYYSDLTIETLRTYSSTNRAIVIDGRSLVTGTETTGRTRPRGVIERVRIQGSTDRTLGISFGAGIDLISLGWIDINSVSISGSSVSGASYNMQGVGLLQRGDGKPVETNVSEIRFYNLEYGYLCPEYTEGVFISDFNLVNVINGIVCSPVTAWKIGTLGQTGCYQIVAKKGHINGSGVRIFLSGARFCTVDDVFMILDDHGVTTTVQGVHLRNGYACTISNLKLTHYSVNLTTGLTRQGIILNAMSDSVIDNFYCDTASTTYENLTNSIRCVSSAQRNTFSKLRILNSTTAVSIDTGCGQNLMREYRFSNVTTSVEDLAGDFGRKNTESRSVTFSPSSASSYTVTLVPNTYFTRRPTGVVCLINTPNTVPMDIFYDYDNSTATSIVLIVKPTLSGSTLPGVACRMSVLIQE